MFLSLGVLIVFVIQHTIFRAFDIIKVATFDCPDKEQPGPCSDAE
jgi:hypothetical protein